MLILRFLLNQILGIGLTYALQRWDKRRLSPEQRERTWNTPSWVLALWWFGPLSMLGWGWVTRRFRGLLLGVACVIALVLVISAADFVLVWALDLPPDPVLDG
jgi:hypothetical protein